MERESSDIKGEEKERNREDGKKERIDRIREDGKEKDRGQAFNKGQYFEERLLASDTVHVTKAKSVLAV